MNSGTAVRRISPMLAVADIEETIAFYRDVLGFTPVVQSSEYSVVEREGQSIHFGRAPKGLVNRLKGHVEIYIEVTGIETLWEHVSQFKDRYKIRDLFERPYGMTEFHIGDPNDCLVFVGQVMAK